jgi:KUP system potassium uptake protein
LRSPFSSAGHTLGITYATARFGYMDTPNVPALIPLIRDAGIASPFDEGDITFFLSTIELHRSDAPGINRWRKQLFLATSHLTADATEYFKLPRDRTVIIGSLIEL